MFWNLKRSSHTAKPAEKFSYRFVFNSDVIWALDSGLPSTGETFGLNGKNCKIFTSCFTKYPQILDSVQTIFRFYLKSWSRKSHFLWTFCKCYHLCAYTPHTISDPIPTQNKFLDLKLFSLSFINLMKWYCRITFISLFKQMNNTFVVMEMAFIWGIYIGKNSFDHKYVDSSFKCHS